MSELGKTIFAFICVTVFGVGVTGTGTELTTAATGNQTEPLTITRPQQLVEIIRVADNTAPEQPGLPYDEPAAEVFQTTTTSTIPVAPGFADARCPDMWDIAIDVGWPVEWLPKFDRIVMAESGCQTDVISRTKDYGYAQINWSAHGSRLTSKGITKDMLLDPRVNLTEALWIANYAHEHYGCWSQPWYMSGDWC